MHEREIQSQTAQQKIESFTDIINFLYTNTFGLRKATTFDTFVLNYTKSSNVKAKFKSTKVLRSELMEIEQITNKEWFELKND